MPCGAPQPTGGTGASLLPTSALGYFGPCSRPETVSRALPGLAAFRRPAIRRRTTAHPISPPPQSPRWYRRSAVPLRLSSMIRSVLRRVREPPLQLLSRAAWLAWSRAGETHHRDRFCWLRSVLRHRAFRASAASRASGALGVRRSSRRVRSGRRGRRSLRYHSLGGPQLDTQPESCALVIGQRELNARVASRRWRAMPSRFRPTS